MKPLNLQVFYEDEHIIVCLKPPHYATQCDKIGAPDMVSLIKNHIARTTCTSGDPYLAVIHRLDQPVSGILVFAKTPAAAKDLNKQLTSHGFGKYYRALVEGTPNPPEGTLEHYLVKNGRTNTSRVCDKGTPGAKRALLHYSVVKKGQGIFNWGRGIFRRSVPRRAPVEVFGQNTPSPIEELDIRLETGRHHQIRVQLSASGHPIVGDAKYNPHTSVQLSGQRQTICLCAYKLDFRHPITHEPLHFELVTTHSAYNNLNLPT